MARYHSPREFRAALRQANGDWTQVLTPSELATVLPAADWGGHTTLRSWLADGASAHTCAQIFWVTQHE